MPIGKFLEWAGHDVTDELPTRGIRILATSQADNIGEPPSQIYVGLGPKTTD